MLIARSNIATLSTISADLRHRQSGLIFTLNEHNELLQVSYTGFNYTLTINFIDHDHEFWTITQPGSTETYSVWRGFPYQKQYSNIKNVLFGEEQARLRHYIAEILTIVRQQETSFN